MYDSFICSNIIRGEDIKINYVDPDYLKEGETEKEWIKNNPIDYVTIKKKRDKSIHYSV